MHILYFSWMRERVGTSSETVALSSIKASLHAGSHTDACNAEETTTSTSTRLDTSGPAVTVGDLIAYLSAQSDAHASAFAQPALIRAAVNQEHVKLSHALSDSDEVALFPPVTGG